MSANVNAAIPARKKDNCIAFNEMSFMNNPPLLHKTAAINTNSNPFLCSDSWFTKKYFFDLIICREIYK